jgi:hypothetical protein
MSHADEQQAEREALTELRQIRRRNIQMLRLQEAKFGTVVPLSILNSIESERQAVADIEQQLAQLDQQLRHTTASPDSTIVRPDLSALYSRYCEHLIATHQTLSFQGVLQTAKPIALPLLAIYVDTRLTPGSGSYDTMSAQERRILAQLEGPCDDTTRQHLEQELETLERTRWSSRSTRVHLAEVLKTAPVSIILGDPGSGKSTLFRYLALVFAQHTAPEHLKVDDQRLPILVPLAAYDRALRTKVLSLSDFLSQYYAEYHELPGLAPLFQTALASGQALVLLDGLDEVVDNDTRVEIAHRVQTFINRYAPNGTRILVTSRIVGYRTAPLPGDHPHYTIADFGMAEIERFTKQWCHAYESYIHGRTAEAEQAARREHRQLMDAIKGAPGIERLAANPLLLTILALIRRQGQSLPRRRVQLYRVYLDTLLEHWSRTRQQGLVVGKALDTFDAIPILGPLALWLQTTKPAGTAQYHDVLREVTKILTDRGSQAPEREARSWLADLREHSGLLVQRGADAWGFLHLTFQEYLAAWGLVRMTPEERWTTLQPHLHDPRWNEVIHLTAGILGVIQHDEAAVTRFVDALLTAGSRVENLLHRDLFLAASVIADDVGILPALGQTIIQQVADVWWEEVHRLRRRQKNGWWSGPISHRGHVAQLAAKLRSTPYLRLLLSQLEPALTDPFPMLRQDALMVFGMAHAWDTIRPLLSDPEIDTNAWLASLLIDDEEWDILQVMLEHSSIDTDAAALCRALAHVNRWDLIDIVIEQSEFNDDSFQEVASFLVEHQRWEWIDPLLSQGPIHERCDIIAALGEYGYLEKIRWALTDGDNNIRDAAVWSFARAGALEVVEPFWHDPEPWIRWAVVWAWQQAEQWDRVLQGLNDPDPSVRSATIRALKATPYQDHGRALLADPDQSVRREAVDLLDATVDHALLLPLLQDTERAIREKAVHKFAEVEEWDVIKPLIFDPNPHFRSMVVETLRDGAPFSYLLPALNDEDGTVRHNVIRAAVIQEEWAFLWSVLEMGDFQTKWIALSGLITKPMLTHEERAQIEAQFRIWNISTFYGVESLKELVTQYEQTLNEAKG